MLERKVMFREIIITNNGNIFTYFCNSDCNKPNLKTDGDPNNKVKKSSYHHKREHIYKPLWLYLPHKNLTKNLQHTVMVTQTLK